MGYNVRLESGGFGHATRLCTNRGGVLVGDWLESLPAAEFPAAASLARDGRFEGTDALAAQLEAAFRTRRPADPDVARNVDRLLDLLGDGRPHEALVLVH